MYFTICQTSTECKNKYRELYLLHSNDSTIMTAINTELKDTLQAIANFEAIQASTPATGTTAQPQPDNSNKQQEITDKAIFARSLDTKLTVEVCNLWVWVFGVIRTDRDLQNKLYNNGFKYGHKKNAWYFHNMKGFRSKKDMSYDQIRLKYNAEPVTQKLSF